MFLKQISFLYYTKRLKIKYIYHHHYHYFMFRMEGIIIIIINLNSLQQVQYSIDSLQPTHPLLGLHQLYRVSQYCCNSLGCGPDHEHSG